ncbi:MAG: uroporphyrinogen-III C-methyltransferase [Chloroflexi bacterium]|nr:MAG: uroporphyrinogen-III C-methyltransferase [Chloroflexota bacterium]
MSAHTPYLIALSVAGRRCVVIGGEEPALAKVRMLLEGDADVSVVAEDVHPELHAMESTGRVRWLRRAFRDDDLSGCFLAINTVFDAALQRRVWGAADARGVLLNTVDNPELCHYSSPALVRRGPLQVAVSTAGESPFLAAALRERLERVVGPEWGQLTGLIGTVRRRMRRRSVSAAAQRIAYRRLLRPDVRDRLRRGDFGSAAALAEALVEHPGRVDGAVHLVGAGPGDAELMTGAATELLAAADAVFHDALVSEAVLSLCNPHARVVNVGKRGGLRSTPQHAITTAMIDAAREGQLVVRLKGGDPFIFGRGGEELAALIAAGIAVRVVPGVSAATAAPALAGIPLTHRGVASSVAFVTAQQRDGGASDGLEALAAAADTLVVLMPLRGLDELAARLARVLGEDRPAALVAAASTPAEQVVTGMLRDIDAAAQRAGVSSPATLVVGEVVRLQSRSSMAERSMEASSGRQTSRSGIFASTPL